MVSASSNLLQYEGVGWGWGSLFVVRSSRPMAVGSGHCDEDAGMTFSFYSFADSDDWRPKPKTRLSAVPMAA